MNKVSIQSLLGVFLLAATIVMLFSKNKTSNSQLQDKRISKNQTERTTKLAQKKTSPADVRKPTTEDLRSLALQETANRFQAKSKPNSGHKIQIATDNRQIEFLNPQIDQKEYQKNFDSALEQFTACFYKSKDTNNSYPGDPSMQDDERRIIDRISAKHGEPVRVQIDWIERNYKTSTTTFKQVRIDALEIDGKFSEYLVAISNMDESGKIEQVPTPDRKFVEISEIDQSDFQGKAELFEEKTSKIYYFSNGENLRITTSKSGRVNFFNANINGTSSSCENISSGTSKCDCN